jgi:hypothetical protein
MLLQNMRGKREADTRSLRVGGTDDILPCDIGVTLGI